MDRRDKDQMRSGTAEAIMFWREETQSRRTSCCFTGRALQARVVQRCVYGSYRYLLDRLGGLRPELVEFAWSGPLGTQLQHRGRLISGSGHRKLEENWLLRNTLNHLTVRPVNICKRCVLQLRLSSDNWSLEQGGSSLILLLVQANKQRHLNRDSRETFWQTNQGNRWELMPINRGESEWFPANTDSKKTAHRAPWAPSFLQNQCPFISTAIQCD